MKITTPAAALMAALLLGGCSLFESQLPSPPPVPTGAQVSATATPTLPPPGTASAGEILFVRDGQIWATRLDGSATRQLTQLGLGVSVRDLTLSPSGQYLAFSVNGAEARLLDLVSGQASTVDSVPAGTVGWFTWSADSAFLYYHKLIADANSLPTTSQIWRVDVPLANPPGRVTEFALASDAALVPEVALAGRLIVHQFRLQEGATGRWLFYDLIGAATPSFAEGYGLWDASPDQSAVLLFSQAESIPDGNAALYLAALTADGAANTTKITPEGEAASYQQARFAPDGRRIIALRYARTENGVLHAEVVLIQPAASGGYEVRVLGADPSQESVAFAWHSESGVIVARVTAGGPPMLWLLPLDGSAGRQIGPGESPVVVGGR